MPSESEPGSQHWIEISVAVDAEAAEAVSALFEQYGEGGAVIEEVPLAPDGRAEAPSWEAGEGVVRCVAKAFLPAGDGERLDALQKALWHLGQLHSLGTPEVRELGPADWAEAWKSGYQVLRIGHRTRIVPSWIPYTPAAGEIVVTLDPGMAFGTGLHPSTQLCLQAMEELVRPGMRILDVGTGSGILAIAAARLGAQVLAVDIEAVAVRTARENVALNGVADLVQVLQGSVDDAYRGSFDGVLANILAEIIARLAPDLARHVAPRGWLIASGIIEGRLQAVERALGVAGLEAVRHWREGDWVALEARRRRKERG
ncbi:MAG: 50S ribosomal protein L11 methyltransferase [Anaerolineae bacterium]|nr:50S ribosomal protein L11 methyltransferase [Anaerolineae bacterium]